ncbi:hypothetical protein [Thiothrix nivea]|uniref:Uncharacterized protein n=1 Tax=Thiothrix nivea (strain ATCC 35100 / DSM 5205 / JP2) TaxID=870187 RepID=A0A656HDQ9_THINJ|nr:hypothetical protein [Thiothrix nivea]EIJ33319.1 hypothetical protein Thini_0682 [Thiothrix nivea DSM 5205]
MPADIKEYDVALYLNIETTEGTAATIAAANALYCQEMSWSVKDKTVRRDFRTQARPLDTVDQALLQWWEFSAKVPWMYSGAAGTAGPLANMFRMCGAAATTAAGVSVTYARDTLTGFDTSTMEMRTPLSSGAKDYRRRTTGARGQLGFRFAAGEDMVFNLSGVGAYYDPDAVTVIAPAYGAQLANIFGPPRPSLITTKALNGKMLCLQSVESSNFFGYKSEWQESMCLARAEPSTDENGTLKVSMKMSDWETEFNPFAYANRATVQRLPFAFSIGSVAGKKLDVTVAEVQMGELSEIILPNNSRGVEFSLNILHNPVIVEK